MTALTGIKLAVFHTAHYQLAHLLHQFQQELSITQQTIICSTTATLQLGNK